MNKVAIYGRVSTNEQHVDNQVIELKKYCLNRGLAIYDIYLDKGVSGSKESRQEFNRMMLDASKRKFNLLLVWKLDRLSRSLKHLLNTLDTLQTLNISFINKKDLFISINFCTRWNRNITIDINFLKLIINFSHLLKNIISKYLCYNFFYIVITG